MKLMVSGSRELKGRAHDKRTLRELDLFRLELRDAGHEIEMLMHGNCEGADQIAAEWARNRGIAVDSFSYPKQYGKGGGPIRNGWLVAECDALCAFPMGPSHKRRGTNDAISQAEKACLWVRVAEVDE